MTYTPEAINAQVERWNKAAMTLPPPTRDGNVDMREDLRFTTYMTYEPETRKPKLHWELMTPQWKPTGIVWPAECYVANVAGQATSAKKPQDSIR